MNSLTYLQILIFLSIGLSTLFLFSESVMALLVLLIVIMTIMSSILFLSGLSSVPFFLLIIALVGGMMVLMSFMIMANPEKPWKFWQFSGFRWNMVWKFSLLVTCYLMSKNWEVFGEKTSFWMEEMQLMPILMKSEMVLFSFFISGVVFLILILLVLLFVVDSLLQKEGGSMLP